MRPTGFTLALLAALALASLPVAAEEARLVVLHTTDLHGALTDYDYLADRPASRGLVRIASMVRSIRAEGAPVLLLDAGDCIQGSPLEAIYQRGPRDRPEPMMTAMSRMGYDAMAVGNHEFDWGLGALKDARLDASFPWLAANVEHETDAAPSFQSTLIKQLGPLKVGVIGLCTPAVPLMTDSANVAGLRFTSPLIAALREVERLRSAGKCDVVILLVHSGLEHDPATGVLRSGDTPDENWGDRLATQVPGVDLVILGHTHQVVPTLTMGGALVTQAGRGGEQLGRAELRFERAAPGAPWALASRQARVLAVADSIPADTALASFALPYHQAAQLHLDQPVGRVSRALAAPRGRFSDSPLLELIQHAQLEASGADVSLATLVDPDQVLGPGIVTLRDLMRLLPYENTLGVVEMTGAQLKRALEQSARVLAAYNYQAGRSLTEPGIPLGNFDAAGGVEYEIDLSRPVGDRIVNLWHRGEPLAPDRVLRVAVNSYRMNGGGGFESVSGAPRRWHSSGTVRDLVSDYLHDAGTLDLAADPRWRILPDYAVTPERPLIDRLVRQGVAPREEVHRLEPDAPSRTGDLAYWLARAYGWREKRLSGAFADAPDSLEPWLDGLLKRGVLGAAAREELIHPFAPARVGQALDWCTAAALYVGYALGEEAERQSFRRGLSTGVRLGHPADAASRDTLTRSQLIGLVANARFPELRVLETTDFHGFVFPGRRNGRALGGTVALVGWLARLRAENPEGTVLLDGGDLFQGTMISNLQFGRPIVEQMNLLGYAAAAVGNHEFDWTADTLERRVHAMHFAALGANMLERRSGRMPRWVRADTVLTRRGVRLGVLGLCYRSTPSVTLPQNVAHLRFADDSATAARRAPELRKRGLASVVVGLGHIPAESDSNWRATGGDLVRLARGVRGVDAWFGGHSHNLVLDEVGGVPILIAGAHGEAVGVCDLVVDPVRSRVVEHRAVLLQTWADAVKPDSAWVARVDRWNAGVAAIAAAPIGRNARRLTRDRNSESTLGDLVSDAMRLEVKADVGLQNSGGLRADLPEGVVTRGAIYEVMPFDNTIFTLELKGAELRRGLEDGLRSGRIAQLSGLRVAFDLSRPAGQRIVSLTLPDSSALDDERYYKIATNNFMATGGDNFDALTGGRNRLDTGILVRDALERFVVEACRNGGALDVRPDGRIRRLGGSREERGGR